VRREIERIVRGILRRLRRARRRLKKKARKRYRKRFGGYRLRKRLHSLLVRLRRPLDRLRLRRAGALGPLQEFMRSRPDDALPPDYADLWFLYRTARKRSATTLLEFGSGCSTVVLAVAAQQNGSGHLWTLETEEKWSRANEAALPASLKPFVTVVTAPAVEDDRDIGGWRHSNIPDIDPDFLYLDGPALTSERPVAFDPLDLEARFKPGFVMVVDGRRINSLYLRDRLERSYRFTEMPWRYMFELLE